MRPIRMADNLTTFKCQLSWNVGTSDSWNPQGLSRPVMGLLWLWYERWRKILFLNVWCDICSVIIFTTIHLWLYQINVNNNLEYKYKWSLWKYLFLLYTIFISVNVLISKNIRYCSNHHLWAGESVVSIGLCWFVLSDFLNAVFWFLFICGEPIIFLNFSRTSLSSIVIGLR
jgi:hypothetical protein